MRRLLVLPVALVLALGVAACSDDDEPKANSTTTTTEKRSSGSDGNGDGDATGNGSNSSDPGGSSSDGNGSSSGSSPVDESDLPGEPIEIYPYKDARLGVIGVAADDTLNVRAGPGPKYDVVIELAPLDSGFTATGHNRTVGDAIWVQVRTEDGKAGWVNGRYVAQLGSGQDVTSQLQGEITGDSMEALADAVVIKRLGPADPEGPRRKVVTVHGPSRRGDGSSGITVDVIGLGDDAQTGERLVIVGEPGEGGSDAYFLTSVEASPLCARGLSDEGLCL